MAPTESESTDIVNQVRAISLTSPDRIAVQDGSHSLTYASLMAGADDVAEALRASGVREGMIVGHCFDRTSDAVMAILGILGSGAAYLPVDPRYPLDRIRACLADAEISLLLTDSSSVSITDGLGHPVRILEGNRLTGSDRAREGGRILSDCAYVIYTSGSTGRPKGVAVDRSALSAYADALGDQLGIQEGDRYLHTASFSFSSSVRQWVLPLTRGATIVMAGRQDISDARALLDLVREAKVTVADLVPSYLRSCVQALREEEAGNRRTLLRNDLRLLLTASEPLPADLVHGWREELGHPARMVNMYGQTETAGIVSTYPIPDELPSEGIVPIGGALPGITLMVRSDDGGEVAAGEAGELLVAGPTLAREYVGQKEATRERFMEEDGEEAGRRRIYHSGDRVRLGRGGALEFLGRTDTQVKIRGHRVEIEEVEARLSAHPSVAEAAVIPRVGPDGEATLIAICVPIQGEALDGLAVRRFVAALLPDYMVPATVLRAERLPRTPNGKLDRGALPTVEATRITLSRDFLPPATEDEKLVARIWSDLLGIAEIGTDDDFFELGGHSLLAMRVMSRLRTEGGVPLPVRLLFEYPTVRGLASQLAELREEGEESKRPILARRPEGTPARASFAQKRLWLLHQLDPESSAYNLVAAIRLIGKLDRKALERAVGGVLERHESLRTVFPSIRGEAHAVVEETPELSLAATAVPDESAMRARVRELAGRPYDLEKGPLYRVELLALGDEEHVLTFAMHHIVSDGWSRGILLDELAQLYSAFAAGESDPLSPLPVQYADYVEWQEGWFGAEGLQDQARWWTEALAGAPATSEFPTQRPRPALQSFRGETLDFPISESIARGVRQLGAEEGASPFMVYLAALAGLLSRYSGQEEVVLGSPTAGRADPATEPLIGFFVNTLALRVNLEGDPSFRELVRRTREFSLGAFGNQDLPFDQVVDALRLPRDLSRSSLFQVMFILQNTPPARHRPAGLTMSQVEVPLDAAKYDLTLSLITREHGLTGQIEYNTDLYDREYIERLSRHYLRLLDELLNAPDQSATSLPILTSGEERVLLGEWNDTASDIEEGATVHGLFERQVGLTPDDVALVFGEKKLTYRELDERATQLARYLVGLGVGRETLVGVCIERSVEMIVALLGILKAGGAYVPLDPTYPRDRLGFMVEDSECPVLLLTEKLLGHLPAESVKQVCLDRDWGVISQAAEVDLPEVDSEQIAYVIFTSGSTGRPKGVMVEHRNVVNFFVGMDERIAPDGPVTWLSVTSISFDISVLEIFWTLGRGGRLIVQADEPQAAVGSGTVGSATPIDFSLFYFASETQSDDSDPYQLLFEGARFADSNGFSGIWVPERHFHPFGGIYPSPAVLASAIAAVTQRVKIRTGSVVLPLHDTVRVAEDWAVVDILSRGRVQLSFASGWHDRDFVFFPDRYADRRTVMIQQMEELRNLWRGGSITRTGGEGSPHEIRTLPRPVQPELPIFITAAGTPETYVAAGREGAHLLTHLLGQTVEQVAEKIRMYRDAWKEAGHPGRGTVALMMHTFVGEDLEEVRSIVRGPFREYLRSSVGLISGLAKGRGQDMRSASFTEADMEALLDHAFDRYFETSALMGTLETCLATVERLKGLDVDDVACLIDFGVDRDAVLGSLDRLAELHRRANPGPMESTSEEYIAVPENLERNRVTHMQCTPSYAEMLLAQPGGREALSRLECLMVGGEALPLPLARELAKVVKGKVMNMYGPTETTIWSTTEVVDPADSAVSLGRPIANTDLYVVDRGMMPVPVGVAGELLIGGRGVVRGYWARPELTAERFVTHPLIPERRVYRTGDLVRYRADGRLDFLGRIDHQVKVRGHRIELGEIESLLLDHPAVGESVVIAREDVPGDKRLVAYVVLAGALSDPEAALRDALRVRLPEWMVPQHVVVLEALPRTPNGKTDRKRLPAPDLVASTATFVQPTSGVEQVLAEVWQEVLRRPSVGAEDNFFDLGGHSLLTVRVQALLRERLDMIVPITDLFRFPTIRALAARLGSGEGNAEAGKAVTDAASERAKARLGALSRRRER